MPVEVLERLIKFVPGAIEGIVKYGAVAKCLRAMATDDPVCKPAEDQDKCEGTTESDELLTPQIHAARVLCLLCAASSEARAQTAMPPTGVLYFDGFQCTGTSARSKWSIGWFVKFVIGPHLLCGVLKWVVECKFGKENLFVYRGDCAN